MIVGLSCADANLRYSITNYIYVRRAQSMPELTELQISDDKKFTCWLSEAGHFVVGLPDDKVAAFNLNGYKSPAFAPILFEKVRAYSLYDTVKYLAERFYGAPYEKLYSVNVEREKYKGPLTYQGWLNDLASSLKRYDENCLYNALFKTIEEDSSELALVTDVKTPEDVTAIQSRDGKVVHILTEKLYAGKNAKLNLDIYDAVVDARDCKTSSVYDSVRDVFDSWGISL